MQIKIKNFSRKKEDKNNNFYLTIHEDCLLETLITTLIRSTHATHSKLQLLSSENKK